LTILADLVAYLRQIDAFEATGLFTGLLCVWLLIRQNIWTWPIGLAYALVSLVVFYRVRLYADLAMHVYYVMMNAYGWWYWTRGGRHDAESMQLPVSRTPHRTLAGLGVLFVAASAVIGFLLARYTDAALPYWDTAANAASFIAMWMTARKYIESWYVWFAVDVVLTAIYVYRGIEFYAVLYGVYLGMAVAGWWSWRTSMRERAA
jgi:nicotinamide mononucleotide transporter